MRHNKIRYNADRWWAYCADRMGWQVGHWINGAKADVGCVVTANTYGFDSHSEAASSPTFTTRHQRGAETVDE